MSKEDQRHYYRFTYLKSEHWQNLRIQKLVTVDAKCKICKKRDLSNDVHHIIYRRLFDVQLDDLVVLCRECHAKVHEVLDEFLFLKKFKEARKKWKLTLARVRYGNDIPNSNFVILARRMYKQAEALANFKFPKIKPARLLTDFVKANSSPTQKEWEDFAISYRQRNKDFIASKMNTIAA